MPGDRSAFEGRIAGGGGDVPVSEDMGGDDFLAVDIICEGVGVSEETAASVL
jgi:hypothetical protein